MNCQLDDIGCTEEKPVQGKKGSPVLCSAVCGREKEAPHGAMAQLFLLLLFYCLARAHACRCASSWKGGRVKPYVRPAANLRRENICPIRISGADAILQVTAAE